MGDRPAVDAANHSGAIAHLRMGRADGDSRGEDRLAAWVAASCARHGVPVRVTDAVVVARVAVLLGDAAPPRAPLAVVAGLETPDRVGPVRVELAGASEAGGDHDVIDDGGDDRVLPGQAELGPLTA